jgi:hypothetical protein
MTRLKFFQKMASLWTDGKWLPQNVVELLGNAAFARVVRLFVAERGSSREFPELGDSQILLKLLRALAVRTLAECMTEILPDKKVCRDAVYEIHQLAEELYNFWRRFERFLIVVDSEKSDHRAFKETATHMNHLVRKAYRDICENITSERPPCLSSSGCGFQVGMIARRGGEKFPANMGRFTIFRSFARFYLTRR